MAAEYQYEISGPEPALRRLQEDLQLESSVGVWQEDGPEENEVPGYRWLRTALTEVGLTSDQEAQAAGEELVSVINGALSILFPELRTLRTPAFTREALYPDGNPDARPAPVQVQIRTPPILKITRILANQTQLAYHVPATPDYGLLKVLARRRGSSALRENGSRVLGLIDLAAASDTDYVLLKHAGEIASWEMVYKLRDDLTHVGAKTLSGNQISKIGNTANSFAISQFDARHGLTNNPGSPHTQISLEQGLQWVLDAVRDYMTPRL